jgi:phosphatidylglycerophosphate synthase
MVIPAIVIISREIAISALREWMAELGKRANVAVSHIGKWKTTAQMTAITVLLVQHPMLNYLGYFVICRCSADNLVNVDLFEGCLARFKSAQC